MSYYRLKADFENMFQPERRNRSCSLPREMSGYDFGDRHSRARSVGPVDRFSHEPDLPFNSRALSVPPLDYLDVSRYRFARNLEPSWYTYYQEARSSYYDYTHDYYHPRSYYYGYHDYLPRYYSSYEPSYYEPRLTRTPYHGYGHYQESLGYDNPTSYNISLSDYYGSNKYNDYVYSSSNDVLGRWKHYNRSNNTLNERTQRATSPLVSRELDRYFSTGGRTDSMDIGSRGAADFRHYNYRRVRYYGASDNYHNLNKTFLEQNRKEGRAF